MFRNFFGGGGWGSTEVMGNAMKHVSMEEVGVWGEGGGALDGPMVLILAIS